MASPLKQVYKWVYFTTPDKAVAHRLATLLVEKKLVAGVNILGPLESVFHWKGKIENNTEFACVAKTTSEKIDLVIEWVCANHPYEVPAIDVLNIQEGNAEYLRWIETSLR